MPDCPAAGGRCYESAMPNPLPTAAVLVFACGVAFADCPVTLPSSSPVVVPEDEPSASHAWFGSEALAIHLPSDGVWRGMGRDHHYRDKLWFWRRGYSARSETQPKLTLDGVKQGADEERLHIADATNAFGPDWDRMLVGMEFPSAGCWRVTATYVRADIHHEVTFVVEVVDSTQDSAHGSNEGGGQTIGDRLREALPRVEVWVVDARIQADHAAAADQSAQQGR
jgi:hypothetical protein